MDIDRIWKEKGKNMKWPSPLKVAANPTPRTNTTPPKHPSAPLSPFPNANTHPNTSPRIALTTRNPSTDTGPHLPPDRLHARCNGLRGPKKQNKAESSRIRKKRLTHVDKSTHSLPPRPRAPVMRYTDAYRWCGLWAWGGKTGKARQGRRTVCVCIEFFLIFFF